MRDDLFHSPKRRLAGAKEHFGDVKAGLEAFIAEKPYARVIERNARGLEEHKVKLTNDIPDRITDFAYDTIEDLRSSLDQTVYSVGMACHSTIKPDLMQFPIADEPAHVENLIRGKLQDFPPNILSLFRSFKPYKTGNSIIWALNRIRRQSYHRLMIPVGTAIHKAQINSAYISSPHPAEFPAPFWDRGKNEMIVAITGPGSNLQYDIQLSFFVAFGPVEGVAGKPVFQTLKAMTREVERIVMATEAETRRLGLIP